MAKFKKDKPSQWFPWFLPCCVQPSLLLPSVWRARTLSSLCFCQQRLFQLKNVWNLRGKQWDRESRSSERTVCVSACLLVLLCVLCGTMADDSFLHTGFHNFHFLHRWLYSFTVMCSTLLGLTGAEQAPKNGCCPCQDNQRSQQAGDLTKQMDLEHTRTWTSLAYLRIECCCAAKSDILGFFLILACRGL